jgi:hypothetical protein
MCLIVPASCQDLSQNSVIIDFIADQTTGTVPMTVIFTDISDVPGAVYSRTWYFGDGITLPSDSPEIAHTYTAAGVFTVQMHRADDQGVHTRIKYNYITVEPPGTPTTPTTPVTPTTPTTMITTAPTTPATTITTPQTTPPTVQPTPSPTGTSPVIPPDEFYGYATVLGDPVQAGMTITARLDGRDAGSVLVTAPGSYGGPGAFDPRLKVYATPADLESGPLEITFWLNGESKAIQTSVFQSSFSQQLDLTFPGLPTTAPTTAPTTIQTTTPATTQPTATATGSPRPTGRPTVQPTIPTPIPTLTPVPYLELEEGWNFVSVPRILAPGSDNGSIFSGVDTRSHSIWTYNASTLEWERVRPWTPVRPLEGMWIYSGNRFQVPLSFASVQGLVERELTVGWNSFGLANITNVTARDALGQLDETWDKVIGYNPATQTYEQSIVRNGSGDHRDDRVLLPGRGYWISVTGNVTYRAYIPSSASPGYL